MLIDISYFTKGSRRIANVTETPIKPESVAANKQVEAYIDEYEGQFLVKALGEVKAAEIVAYIEDEAHEPREDFDAIIEKLKEPCADYVSYHFLKYANTEVTPVGTVSLKGSNTYMSAARLMTCIWNEMVEKMRTFRDWMYENHCGEGYVIYGSITTKITESWI